MPTSDRRKRGLSYWRMSLVALLALVVPPLAFYGWFESRSRTVVSERKLDPSYRNALKHASAAAGLYTMLRTIGVSQTIAEASVVNLGYLNERAELVIKRGKRDTTAEMAKDLQNNMVGIGVARWLEGRNGDEQRDRWELLLRLGEKGVLRLSSHDVEVEAGIAQSGVASSDFTAACEWFEGRRDKIDGDVKRSLLELSRAWT